MHDDVRLVDERIDLAVVRLRTGHDRSGRKVVVLGHRAKRRSVDSHATPLRHVQESELLPLRRQHLLVFFVLAPLLL